MNVTVVRSKRKTLVLSVNEKGEAVVRAPLYTSNAEIGSFVEKHKLWLSRRIAERKQVTPDFSDGSTVCLMGRRVTVATGRARLAGEILYLPAEGRTEALQTLLKKLTRERMTKFTAEIAARYGFSYNGVSVTSARGRWGSCSAKGKINYSFRSAFLPDELAVYIVVHELCHTRHFNHSAAFWREVGNVVPDYAVRRKALKGYLWAMRSI